MTDANLAVLAPLMKLIEDTVRSTPISLGPGGTDDLSAKLTVRACTWLGKNVLPRTPGLAAIVSDVDDERQRQLAKWGEQHHPDGTGQYPETIDADVARMACQSAAEGGYLDWLHILREEVAEAFAESDPAKLRTELIQVAAVCAAWISDLDRRPVAAADSVPCTACLLPLNSEPVEPCVTRGKHDVHTTAAGQRWTGPNLEKEQS